MLTPQQTSDHIEITQLLYRYATAIDTRDFDSLSSLFTADATIHTQGRFLSPADVVK